MRADALFSMSFQGSPRFRAINGRRAACLALLTFTVPLGLLWRLAPLHLPQCAFKYGGSALWAIAVYWTCAIFLPRRSSVRLAFIAATLSLAVELIKLVYWSPLDRFRETLPGKLLLGRPLLRLAQSPRTGPPSQWSPAWISGSVAPGSRKGWVPRKEAGRNTLGAATNPPFQVR